MTDTPAKSAMRQALRTSPEFFTTVADGLMPLALFASDRRTGCGVEEKRSDLTRSTSLGGGAC